MLEDFAIFVFSQPERTLLFLSYGVVALGAGLAWLLSKSKAELQRAPYFAFTAALLCLASLNSLSGILAIQALKKELLWVLLLALFVWTAGLGYAFAYISLARVRDAFNRSWPALLAFLPPLNVILLFTPSKQSVSANRLSPNAFFAGGLGILTGIAFLGASYVLGAALDDYNTRTVRALQEDPNVRDKLVGYSIRSQGLENTLEQLASTTQRMAIDESTILLRVEHSGRVLTYVMELAPDVPGVSPAVQSQLQEYACRDVVLHQLLNSGATLEYVYQTSSGAVLRSVEISRESCPN